MGHYVVKYDGVRLGIKQAGRRINGTKRISPCDNFKGKTPENEWKKHQERWSVREI